MRSYKQKCAKRVFSVIVKMEEAMGPAPLLHRNKKAVKQSCFPSSPVFMATGITNGEFYTNQPFGSNACCWLPA